jgi:hypothetical protein
VKGTWLAIDPLDGGEIYENIGVHGVWTRRDGRWGIRAFTPEERALAEQILDPTLLKRCDRRASRVIEDSWR